MEIKEVDLNPNNVKNMVRLVIGDIAKQYIVVETTAEKGYDGFGTLEIYDSGNEQKPDRFVLIETENFAWQIQRYWSGNRAVEVHDDHSMTGFMIQKLWERVTGKDKPEPLFSYTYTYGSGMDESLEQHVVVAASRAEADKLVTDFAKFEVVEKPVAKGVVL